MRAIEEMYNAIEDFLKRSADVPSIEELEAHTEDKANPHDVTKAQLGLGNVDNVKQASKSDFDAHTAAANPHGINKNKVGLGNVDNVKQAAKADYDAHIAGTADKHSGSDVMYSAGKSVTQKINELIIDGGGGTMYHDELLNRGLADAHPSGAITGLGEVLTFTGQTEGGNGTVAEHAWALCDRESPLITRGYYGSKQTDFITPPSGVVFVSVKAVCSPVEASDAEDYARGFSVEGIVALDDSGESDAYILYTGDTAVCKKETDDAEEPKCELLLSATKGAYIYFTGTKVADKTLNWRASVRLAPWEEGAGVEAD